MKMLGAILLAGAMLLATAAEARDRGEVRRFKKAHPCPFTKRQGCIVDHVVPLCAGGADKISNMQWQTKRQSYRKDTVERRQCRGQR